MPCDKACLTDDRSHDATLPSLAITLPAGEIVIAGIFAARRAFSTYRFNVVASCQTSVKPRQYFPLLFVENGGAVNGIPSLVLYSLAATCPKDPEPCPSNRSRFGSCARAAAICPHRSASTSGLTVRGRVLSVISDPPSLINISSPILLFYHRVFDSA
jgi:hypothetical protein